MSSKLLSFGSWDFITLLMLRLTPTATVSSANEGIYLAQWLSNSVWNQSCLFPSNKKKGPPSCNRRGASFGRQLHNTGMVYRLHIERRTYVLEHHWGQFVVLVRWKIVEYYLVDESKAITNVAVDYKWGCFEFHSRRVWSLNEKIIEIWVNFTNHLNSCNIPHQWIGVDAKTQSRSSGWQIV